MKFRKGNIVVITGNEYRIPMLCTWFKHCWERVIGENGVFLGVRPDGYSEVIHEKANGDTIASFTYHNSELTKVGHIHKAHWKNLDLPGFGEES